MNHSVGGRAPEAAAHVFQGCKLGMFEEFRLAWRLPLHNANQMKLARRSRTGDWTAECPLHVIIISFRAFPFLLIDGYAKLFSYQQTRY